MRGLARHEHKRDEIPFRKEVFRMADERNHDQGHGQENIVELFDEEGNTSNSSTS
jgi:hypothetical protein